MPETNNNLSEGSTEYSGEMTTGNKKMSTSNAQRIDHCKDGACDKHEDGIKSSGEDVNDIDDMDAVCANLGKVNISSADNSSDDVDDIVGGIISDDKLFQDPPPNKDCPICMLPMPFARGMCGVDDAYMPCCGKTLCHGCMVAADREMDKGKIKSCCLFCRTPLPKSKKEFDQRMKKRMKLNDVDAFHELGTMYLDEQMRLSKKVTKKTLKMWHKAAELGSCKSHHDLSIIYSNGDEVEKHKEKATYHLKLAAMGGHEYARYKLGMIEYHLGNMDRAMKHFMIAARCGYEDSLKKVGKGYKHGLVTKDDYAKTLRAYQNISNDMKSEQRTKAEQK